MVKRSLQASLPGIQQAKQAFEYKGWTQENLAGEVGLKTRQPIWRFFTGQPVERHFFLEVCLLLGLDWREIAVNPPIEFPEVVETDKVIVSTDIDILVQQVRLKRQGRIQDRCGTVQLLDINQPVRIDDIYIDVSVLENIPSQQWLELSDLQHFTPNELDHLGLGDGSQSQIEGIGAVKIYSKLRVLGNPGSGKTTFLNHLATQCNRGHFAANRVPIFITLRDFADESRSIGDFSLLSYIGEEFLTSGISEPSVLETLFLEGRVLLLLDGLDEVLYQERKIVVREIRRLSEKYQQNLFVVTCRTAAKSLSLMRFTDVEIASFTPDKVVTFAQKWFTTLTKTKINRYDSQELAERFIENLDLPENRPIRRLVITPLFLHLACWVFLHQQRFPTQRSQFYKQCLDLLLSRWDETRGIERDEIYRSFLLPQRLKLLGQVAAATFEQGEYFFEQQTVEQCIRDYLRDLPNAPTEPEELQLESEAILRAIELQHGLLAERARGVFSFSHLTFQEYFTARKIVTTYSLQASEQSLEHLVSHITDPRWREVFLLAIAMLPNADALVQLMKQKIDAIVAPDPYLQEFLAWASQQSTATLSPAATRAFSFALAHRRDLVPHLALSSTLDQEIFLNMVLDDLVEKCVAATADFALTQACIHALNNALIMVIDSELYQALQSLKNQLSSWTKNPKRFQAWWQANALDWTERLRDAIAKYHNVQNVQNDWQFSSEQQQLLQRYYDASQLLSDCLNSACKVTATVQQEIKATLLLPQSIARKQH